jgi:hypothetical protein
MDNHSRIHQKLSVVLIVSSQSMIVILQFRMVLVNYLVEFWQCIHVLVVHPVYQIFDKGPVGC